VKKEIHILMLKDNATDAELIAHSPREGHSILQPASRA
jgi:hypothetical protein